MIWIAIPIAAIFFVAGFAFAMMGDSADWPIRGG
jgi:hypothetical protein